MARAENTQLIDAFEEFYRNYYRNEIGDLAQKYPNEKRSLFIDWSDLYRFDSDLADDYRSQPGQLQEYAEEALRLYDLPVDVGLGRAHVRIAGLPDTTDIRDIRARHRGQLLSVQGMVRKATDVRPKITEAAFECQRCGTLTRIPQSGGDFQEPHECQGCERQGPFTINFDQSEFVDAQKLRVQESPEGLRGGETPQNIDVHIEDDITGEVTAGDHVRVTGVLHLDQQETGRDASPMFDVFMDGVTVEIEDEQFEEMDISEADERAIAELAADEDIYDRMVDSIAPSIYGYEQAKLAMILQLFSGVTKHLPDGSRIRGDLHMLLIGDPGTGKCVAGDTRVTLADGRERPIRDVVEEHLDDPVPVDDGVYGEIDLPVPSMNHEGEMIEQRATKVWKREAPESLYRVRTASGSEIEMTPSHPLFVQSEGGFEPVTAENLSEGQFVATPRTLSSDGDDTLGVDDRRSSWNGVAPDGGRAVDATGSRSNRTDATPDSRENIGGAPGTTENDIAWDRITSIEQVEPDEDWVYDLEVAGTHNYLTNNVISHNSALLQYIRNIAPRSVYTSGKGSSSAGLCVTGDTRIHTEDGFVPIEDLATPHHPEPVTENTATACEIGVETYDEATGEMEREDSSHVWRMPEKPCRRIETTHGKELEASVNTPVLTCGEHGVEWREISEVTAGDHVAVPKHTDIERSTPPVDEYLEFTNEKVRLTEESIEFVRNRLHETFGTLRDAAAELDLPEDFVYDSLSNRFVPLERLDRVLQGIDATREDVTIRRAMLRHGDDVRLPREFDADLLYLVGLVFGDGDIALSRREDNRGLVRISNGDESLLRRAADIIEQVFDKRVEIERQEDKVPCIRLYSATVARFFANLGMQTPKDDLALDERLTTAEHADAFLRGLMDADGSVSARTNGGSSVHFSTISDDLATQVTLMLETYGVQARTRERDRCGEYALPSGQVIETKQVQTHLELYGQDIEAYADAIGFESAAKTAALGRIVGDAARRGDRLPIGGALAAVEGSAGAYYQNLRRGDNPGRGRARTMLHDLDLGDAAPVVEETVDADLRWDEVVAATDTGEKEVFDLTVPETHNFVADGIVTHNTAAAVRDDFGDGQQWTLEAGALVLADKGIAAVDELDKMDSSDRSAMHEALEQQTISVSKAGINATLKSRCSLLGAANPKYGRFDQYESIGEQIDLEPALISRFDLIFTVTDEPDEEHDRELADHILTTNYAGEMHTNRTETSDPAFSAEEVDRVTEEVAPAIDPDLLRKYVAHAKRNCYPTMSEEAKDAIEEFYVDFRSRGTGEDAPIPVTARKLEALVRLAEASARIRLAETVELEDAERVIEIVQSCLRDIGMDPETGEFDADIVETGTSKTQRDRIKNVRALIADIEDDHDEGAPVEEVLDRAEEVDMERSKAESEIEKLRRQGEVYEPRTDHLRTT